MIPPQTVAFDARPLTEQVDRATVRAFGKRLRAEGRVPSALGSTSAVVGVAAVIIFFVIFGSVFTAVLGAVFSALSRSQSAGSAVLGLIPLGLIVGVVVLTVVLIARGQQRTRERWYRLERFAQGNRMTYVPRLDDPQLPGMIFRRGDGRQSSDLVRGHQPRFVEFANYRYATGSGKNRTTHRWGYVAVKLDVPLPHIVLDAVGNNGLFGSNLPMTYGREQRLSLEGDFDRHFSLYCPQGYERDALYLFTPDIMARFIDNAAQLDVEIVDDWLFLYAKRDLSTLDPATWAWLFSAVAALLDKLAQWARWRDERLAASFVPVTGSPAGSAAPGSPGAPAPLPVPMLTPPPGVAPPGRRLKAGVPWVAIVIVGIIAVVWAIPYIGGLAALLGR